MGKVALVTVARTKLRRHISPLSRPLEPKQAILRQSQSCAKAARKLLLLFETVTRNQMITRFSFTDFQGCSIATIVTLVYGITEPDSGYNARVSFGLDCLRKMSTGNMTAKMGVKFVEAVQTITDEAREKVQAASVVNTVQEPQSSTPASACDYNRWAEWFTNQERLQMQDQRLPEEGNITSGHDVSSSQTSLPPDISNVETMSSWRSANEQFPLDENLLPQTLFTTREAQFPDYDFSSVIQNDDATFLMGLTGLDVLDFSGFR
jgi:hypothetical protein